MLSASGDCPPKPTSDQELCWGQMGNGQKILQKFILVYVQNVVISRGLRSLESLTRGFASGPHALGQAPRTFYRLSSKLAQILPSYIIQVFSSLRSSSTTISAEKHQRPLQDLFHPLHLMSGMSCLSMFPLSRRCQFSEGKHHLFHQAYPGFTTPTIKVGIYHSIMSSTKRVSTQRLQSADSCILAWVLLNTGACANAALFTY